MPARVSRCVNGDSCPGQTLSKDLAREPTGQQTVVLGIDRSDVRRHVETTKRCVPHDGLADLAAIDKQQREPIAHEFPLRLLAVVTRRHKGAHPAAVESSDGSGEVLAPGSPCLALGLAKDDQLQA